VLTSPGQQCAPFRLSLPQAKWNWPQGFRGLVLGSCNANLAGNPGTDGTFSSFPAQDTVKPIFAMIGKGTSFTRADRSSKTKPRFSAWGDRARFARRGAGE